MVRDVKRVLQRGPCTLSQLVAELGAERELVRSALHFWLTRGDLELEVGRREATCGADSHCGCGAGAARDATPGVGPAVYSWR